MTTRRISRRTVLRGLGATVALPLLDVMRPVSALGGSAAAGVPLLLPERHRARHVASGRDRPGWAADTP